MNTNAKTIGPAAEEHLVHDSAHWMRTASPADRRTIDALVAEYETTTHLSQAPFYRVGVQTIETRIGSRILEVW